MNAANRESLWQRLCAADLAQGDMPAATTVFTPWYIRLMLGIAGWIGALFFIGFLGTAFVLIFRNGAATVGVGALCCAGAYALFRMAREQDFVPQFGLAVSMAGQILVVAGLFNLLDEHFDARLYLVIAAFEIWTNHRCFPRMMRESIPTDARRPGRAARPVGNQRAAATRASSALQP